MSSKNTKKTKTKPKPFICSELHRIMAGKNRRFEDSRKKREQQQRRQHLHEQLN